AGTKRAVRTTGNVSYSKKKRFNSFESINFSDGQRKALKILGIFLLFASFIMAVSFVSYLFTWKQDQSYITETNGGWSTLFRSTDEMADDAIELPIVENKLGKLGALLANQFIYKWFGIASFLFTFILFIVGYKFLYRKSLLPVWKTIIYSATAIIYLSVTLGVLQDFLTDSPHILEGKFGYWTNQLLKIQIGSTGIAALLAFAYLAILILIYNLDLKWTWASKKTDEDEEVADEEDNFDTFANKSNTISNVARNTAHRPIETAIEDESLLNESFESQSQAPLVQNIPDEPQRNNEHEITFTVDTPEIIDRPVDSKQEPVTTGPVLSVEKVVEEKAITANDLVAEFGEYDPKLDLSGYQYPTLDLLKEYGSGKITINQQELEANKNRIVETLRNYSIEIEHIKATIGTTVTLYEIIPKPGVRISKIKNLEDDIALGLAALGIRILAPMPSKGTIGIEVPNSSPEMVSMRSVLATEKYQNTDMDLPIALGKTISNEVYIADLAKMPHLLVAGATGQGKSVGINAILTSILYKKHPAELKFVMVDPKKVELSLFKTIERHFLAKLPNEDEAIITDTK